MSGGSTGATTGKGRDMAADVRANEERARRIRLCRWEADRWRRQAGHVRDHATLPHLDAAAQATLLRSADWCEDTAAYWEAGAREYKTMDTPTQPNPNPTENEPCSQ